MASDSNPHFLDIDWPLFDSVETLIVSCFGQECTSVKVSDPNGPQGIGKGFCSESMTAVATMKDGNDVNVFIKTCFGDKKVVTADSADITSISSENNFPALVNSLTFSFAKEANFYKSILPQLLAFRKSRGITDDDLDSFFVKCCGIGKVGQNFHIVLEDFSSQGFAVMKKEEFQTNQHVLPCLIALAEYHATSYCQHLVDPAFVNGAYANGRLFDYNAATPHFAPFFCFLPKKHLTFLTELLKRPQHLSDVHVPASVTLEVLAKLLTASDSLYDMIRRARLPTAAPKHSVICHGDVSMFNMAFGKDSSQVLFFDTQIVHYGSFANELHQYLSQSTTPADRRSNLKAYLRVYSDRFVAACQRMGISEEEQLKPFRPEGVEAEYRDKAAVGFLFGISFVLPRFVNDLPTQLDSIDLKNNKKLHAMVQLYLDFIDECVANGTFESLELYGH